MPKYVDGFVLVVKKSKVAAYRKMAKEAGKMWMKFGALEYMECIGDDLKPNMGGMTGLTFIKLTKLKKGETVWFSFITFKSKQHRDQVNKKIYAEMEKKYENHKDMSDMPWDMKRMSYGGFKAEVQY